MNWPEWWDWDIEISSHCLKRMQEHDFNEADLRGMLDDATGLLQQDHGTYIVETMHVDTRWEIIVSPDDDERLVIVVSAYPDP